MKTKIIYISGNEVFDMTDVRAAFEQVRTALGLGKDTILFGVPVDSDNALADISVTEKDITAVSETPTATFCCENSGAVADESVTEIIGSATDVSTQPSEKESDLVIDVQQSETATTVAPEQDTIIPILSVLSVQEEDVIDSSEMVTGVEAVQSEIADSESVSEVTDQETENVTAIEEEPVISSISIDSELIAPATDSDTVATTVSISDMINDDAPVAPVEKTLEQLLESMTPLREDQSIAEYDEKTNIVSEESFDDFIDTDTDATLAQLASEFAETEDTISVPKKNESHGKIGKLKNILPFKKAKRDDNGLIGDLFGWAGIAANDDDFSIPGFFTKKQGA